MLVGHSLGAILAYDLISYFWAAQREARTVRAGTREFDALREVEATAARLATGPSPAARAAYAGAQRTLRRALAARSGTSSFARRWLISDLVTMGNPLTHAEFLLARSAADLEGRVEARELPVSPPYREALDPGVREAAKAAGLLPPDAPESARLMTFPDGIGSGRWTMHHAAPFAAVRWTNLYDPARFVFLGDLIGGPVGDVFGPAIDETNLSTLDGRSRRLTHSRYWAADQSPVRIEALRQAINLLDVPPPG